MTTRERLQRILIDDYQLAAGDLAPATVLADLGVDSLDMIELVGKIEDEFGIVAPSEALKLTTLQDVIDYIDRLIGAEVAAGDAQSQAA